jgi:hypothetical protein
MSKVITKGDWILLHEGGEHVLEGSTVTSFRGEQYTITGGRPPHKPESTGRVYTSGGEFFPSVFNLVWQKTTNK